LASSDKLGWRICSATGRLELDAPQFVGFALELDVQTGMLEAHGVFVAPADEGVGVLEYDEDLASRTRAKLGFAFDIQTFRDALETK
jgi:hypothetical protein